MITEHNCEEYFLLYTDNELTAPQRKAVEDFVKNHPRYMPLFTALQDTKLTGDEVSFLNKEALYKDEASDIGIGNHEEYFLLYTDDELSNEQRETTERFVLQHPQLQEEFTLLQQTRLTPEVIVYKNKEELYKRERRVIPFYFVGLSVAAVLLAVLFFTGVIAPHQSIDDHAIASISVKQKAVKMMLGKKESAPDVVVDAHQQQSVPVTDVIRKETGKTKGITASESNKAVTKNEPAVQPAQPAHEEIAVAHHTEEPNETARVSLPENKPMTKQAAVLKPLEEFDGEQANTTAVLSLSDNSNVQPAVYKELDTKENNHSLYISGIEVNKNKVNGFLKSASRLLGGRNRQDSE